MKANLPLKVFCSYSHKDEDALEQLRRHLAGLRRAGLITDWYDRQIPIGGDWDATIKANLEAADLILLLISADFIHSDYCMNLETARALERNVEATVTVIPIFWRECLIQGLAFESLQGTPKDMHWISQQADKDKAWAEVVGRVREATQPQEGSIGLASRDPLQTIRRNLLVAQSEHELRRLRYEINAYIATHPHSTDGLMLQEQIDGVLANERPLLKHPPYYKKSSKYWLLLLALLIAVLALWYFLSQNQSLNTAENLLDQGEYQQAKQYCEQAKPSQAREHCLAITGLMLKDKSREAFLAEASNTDSVYAVVMQAEDATAHKEFAAAEQLYKQALAENPKISQAYYGLGQVYQLQNKPVDALSWYKKALERAPKNRRFLFNLASLQAELQQWDEAANTYHQVLNYDNTLMLAYIELIQVYQAQGDRVAVKELAETALNLFQKNQKQWQQQELNQIPWQLTQFKPPQTLYAWDDKQRYFIHFCQQTIDE